VHLDEFWYRESESFNEAIIEIIVFLICMEDESITHCIIFEFFGRERFDVDPCLVEDIGDLSEESELIVEYTLHLQCHSLSLDMTPVSWHTPVWLDFLDICTVELVYRDDSVPDISDDLI
jgi:hypothetical protein